MLLNLPIYRLLYPSVKMLIDSFSPERRSAFKAVVLVQHPREGAYAFGFVTSEVLVDTPAGKRELVTVFIPTNNLYLGDVVVVPRDDVLDTGWASRRHPHHLLGRDGHPPRTSALLRVRGPGTGPPSPALACLGGTLCF